MESNSKPVCRLCLQYCNDNFEAILEIATLHLISFQLNLDLAVSDEPVMCEGCSRALKKSFNFKTMCLNTEDHLSTISKDENILKVEFHEVYIKEEVAESHNDVSERENKCRFCLKPTKCALQLKYITAIETKLANHLPELDLGLTTDPAVCISCYQNLESCFDFISTCCTTEKKISEYCRENGTNSKGQIDLNKVCSIIAKNAKKNSGRGCSPVMVRVEGSGQEEIDAKVDVKMECSEIDEKYNGLEEYHIEKVKVENSSILASQSPRKPSKDNLLKCPICAFKTKRLCDHRRHMLKHKDRSEIVMHQCDVCPYRVTQTTHLNCHQVTDQNSAEVTMHCCKICTYQTKRIDYFEQHLLTHRTGPDGDLRKAGKLPCADRVDKYIGEFPDLSYNGATIICNVCERDLLCRDKYDCKRHVKSAYHKNKKSGMLPTTQFRFDLLVMLIDCDIPLFVLDKQPFREFWEKYCPQVKLPTYATLRCCVPTVRDDIINKIQCLLKNRRLWLCVAEMTDYKKNVIVNIMVRILDPFKPTVPLLLASKRLAECTGKTITRVVLETLEKFELSTSQVLMFVTDGAATMRSVSHSLQQHGCTSVHVTCKVQALQLVAQTIRRMFPEVDALIAGTKNVFLKSPNRLRVFHDKCPGIPEPPQPTFSLWGAWLRAAFYYAQHFQQIKAVILQFDPGEDVAVMKSRARFEDASVETALKTILKNYKCLHDAMEKLQNSTLPLAEAFQIVGEVKQKLQTVEDARNEPVKERLANVLTEDVDFTRLRQICNGASSDPLSAFKNYFKYACITSMDVQLSFSKYKHIYSPTRTSIMETTVETYLMLHSFYKYPVCDNQGSSSS